VSEQATPRERDGAATSGPLWKRAADVTLAGAALVFFLPLLLLVAASVKLDSPGPVLFRQRRTGQSGRVFQIYKFRTMRVMEDGEHVRAASRDDRRVTRIGSFLRRNSLDELPQLLNVLRGDMSLIGPRPHALSHDAAFAQTIPGYEQRFQVKPGMTGLAQVRGLRGEAASTREMAARVQSDLEYVDRLSPKLDLVIALRTLGLLFQREANAF
jgi:putative colanic acid biosynthesis UDP-glucose lipid carrier transferase